MIAVTVEIDQSFTSNLNAIIDKVISVVQDVASDVTNKNASAIKSDLGRYPGAVKYPIQWTSEKQRRAFFATDGFGSGIPYKRTNNLAKSWDVTTSTVNREVFITISNDNEAVKFVVGSLARDATVAQRFKQQFHTNTGWQNAGVIANDWLETLLEEFTAEFDKRVNGYASLKRGT